MRRIGGWSIIFMAILSVQLFAGNVYYVDKANGNDLNNGLSLQTPWKTIKKAGETAMAGDTVYIRAGIYTDNCGHSSILHPHNSGSPDSRITFKNYNGEAVWLSGQYSVIHVQTGIDYITIDGINADGNLTNPNAVDVFACISGNHIIIQNCAFKNMKPGSETQHAIWLRNNNSYCQILNNTVENIGEFMPPGSDDWGDGVRVENDDCHHHLIQGNVFTKCGHLGVDLWGHHNIVKNNICNKTGIGVAGNGNIATYNIIENNVCWDTNYNETPGFPFENSGTCARNTIWRKNRHYYGHGTGLHVWGWSLRNASYSKVYHNVFYDFGRDGIHSWESGMALSEFYDGTLAGVAIKNNIFWKNQADGVSYREYADTSGHVVTNNHWQSNGDPMFADEALYDFHLQDGSPCMDTGAFLTKAKWTASGTQIEVEDASYFIDGFGIVEGDTIQLDGQTPTARITSINYNTNTLTLDRSLNWYAGQGVTLAYSGSAPDQGAFEYVSVNPLTATMTASPTSGLAPLTVNFTGSASGGTSPYSYSWNFGDDQFSTTQNPSHTYSAAGTYTATVTVTDSQSATNSQPLAISVTAAPSPLVANASASPSSGQAPLVVNFTGSASGGTAPYTYRWTFGEGGSSTTQSPSHTYSTIGNFTAILTVTDSLSTTNSKSLTISVTAAPSQLTATASANPTSGLAPLTVNFTGSATGGTAPYTYSWIFGDGSSSTTQNPSHTYSTAGNFTAALTVTDSNSATNSIPIAITVTSVPSQLIATASANPTSGLAPLTVNYTGTATGGDLPYSYSWNFGDGTSSTVQNPSHTYSVVGNYTATLTVTDNFAANANSAVDITVELISTANLALSSETGAPAPGQGGTTDPPPGNHSFSIGSSVEVKSIPSTDYRFSKWAGDISESSTFSSTTTLTMDKNKSLSATFCTKCADVNGDLKITPADAQLAFDIYLGRVSNPTWCELENADVKCDGTRLSPKVTPSDAQVIFHKYLKKGVASGDCSGTSRAAMLSMQNSGITNVNLTISNIAFTPGEDILIPVIIESPSDIKAFGFDLAFPSNILMYIGLESTELTKDYDQLDANVISYQAINQDGTNTEPIENGFSKFDSIFASKILTLQADNSRRLSQDVGQPSVNIINYRMLRVGGYKTKPTVNPSSGVLVTLIFRVIGEVKSPSLISVIATYDDMRNASITNGVINPQNNSQIRKDKRLVRNVERKFTGKRYDF